jgi:hypothetical protein
LSKVIVLTLPIIGSNFLITAALTSSVVL